MKCIIYGLGSGRLTVEKYLKNDHLIIGYTDSFYTGSNFNNKKFYKVEELYKLQFDVIIIAIGDINIRKKIHSKLIKCKISNNKILDFYDIYSLRYTSKLNVPLRRVDRVIRDNYEGIILGISYAATGINPNYLSKKFCNLAVPSQDLYYNLRTLEIVNEKYKKNIQNLKYAIIDMFEYTYFNFDISLSKNAINYYKWSGFRSDDSHNYNKNKNFTRTIEDEINNIHSLDNSNQNNLFSSLFYTEKIDITADYKITGAYNDLFNDFPIIKSRDQSITIDDIEEFKNNYKHTSIQSHKYKKTIDENINIFNKILKTLFSINPKIKIYLVLLPEYKVQFDYKKNDFENIKNVFYSILNKFKNTYNFKILDFKTYEEISSKSCYYYDLGHLNNDGAKAFTTLLDSYIDYED